MPGQSSNNVFHVAFERARQLHQQVNTGLTLVVFNLGNSGNGHPAGLGQVGNREIAVRAPNLATNRPEAMSAVIAPTEPAKRTHPKIDVETSMKLRTSGSLTSQEAPPTPKTKKYKKRMTACARNYLTCGTTVFIDVLNHIYRRASTTVWGLVALLNNIPESRRKNGTRNAVKRPAT